jgi:hypothetical protein
MPIKRTKQIEQPQSQVPGESIGYFESVKGNKSIKRLWGSILLANVVAMGWLIIIVALVKPGINMDYIIKVMEFLGGGGMFLLGINILQYFRGGR